MKSLTKNILALLGPTNTGKTHMAIEKMLEYEYWYFWTSSKASGKRSLRQMC